MGSGQSNTFDILNLIESDETLSTCQMFNAEVCYGSGLVYNTDKSTTKTREQVDDFFLENNIAGYYLGVCQDFKHFAFCVSVIILNADGSKIVRIVRKEACYCRFTPANKQGKIEKVLYANWRVSIASREDIEVIELLDMASPWTDLQERMQAKTKTRKFAIVPRVPTPDSTYYPIPYYAALFKGKWYNIKTLIGMAKEALEKAGKLLTAEGAALKKLYDECEDRDSLRTLSERIELLDRENRLYAPEYKAFMAKGEELRKEMYAYELDYITNNPNLVGLYLLNQARHKLYNKDNATKQPYVDLFKNIYDTKYPTNNMAINMRNWVSSMDVRVASRIIDFTLPDLSGAAHTLSKEIEGKIAIVDFWASWCGPCRRMSMSFIPLYNKYKDKGFTIVGVASELESEDMRLAVEKDGCPWLNLLALRGVENIWERYGIRGGGEVFLIDIDGTILAVGATAEEIERILKDKL